MGSWVMGRVSEPRGSVLQGQLAMPKSHDRVLGLLLLSILYSSFLSVYLVTQFTDFNQKEIKIKSMKAYLIYILSIITPLPKLRTEIFQLNLQQILKIEAKL